MSSIPTVDFRALLVSHPAYQAAMVPCGLPPPQDDPFPTQTRALFLLWEAIRPLVSSHAGMPMLLSTSGTTGVNLSPIERFQRIRPSLVSILSLFYELFELADGFSRPPIIGQSLFLVWRAKLATGCASGRNSLWMPVKARTIQLSYSAIVVWFLLCRWNSKRM